MGHRYNEPWISRNEVFMKEQNQFFLKVFKQSGIAERYLSKLKLVDRILAYSCNRNLDRFLEEGDEVPGLKGWRSLETPGHAQSHISLFYKNEGLLIGGDLLLPKVSSNPLLEPPMEGKDRPRPQLQYNESLKRLLSIPIKTVLPGHGETVKNSHGLIRYRLKRQKERAFSILSYLKEKPMTSFEICARLFPSEYIKQLMLTMSETIGQLDYLEEIGEIKKEAINNVDYYSLSHS
ncbi:MBL fold metallo-hydrolase [Metabacillus arenae]|uniref:MBL fold metallo-hydrolase n=1 Tax=Metabacillus arenae TaxID=2771434 RepID=UPI0037C6432C